MFIKKIAALLLFMLLALPAFSQTNQETPMQAEESKPFEIGVSFDWISKTQLQRDENIKQIQGILFSEKTVLKYPKNKFKEKYKTYWKDPDFLKHYEEISASKKEDDEKNYCGFYWKNILVAYGIQYKNDMENITYYDAMGNLRWVDVFSNNYPTFPYWSFQYSRNGEMVGAFYYVSDYDQYVFNPNKKFIGRWYKENMYNKNAKIIMTRSNW